MTAWQRLSYCTDVEGNWDYWCRFVEKSKALDFQTNVSRNAPDAVVLRENCAFVFGGDAFDKGPGDLRIGAQLVSLKERYPDRVWLMMGNRDINKMRFTAELHPDDLSRPLNEIPGPFWVVEQERVTPRAYLERLARDRISSDASMSIDDLDREIERLNTRLNRLHWMLEHTLGCDGTFEHRRQELKTLAAERGQPNYDPSDDDVLQSMLDSVQRPDGVVRRYLELATPAVQIENTMFVHGAAEPAAVGWIPADDHPYAVIDDGPEGSVSGGRNVRAEMSAKSWIEELDSFARRAFDDWLQRPTFDASRNSRGGEALIAYQSRPAMRDRTVVVSSYSFGGNMPQPRYRGSTTKAGAGDANTIDIIDVSDPLDPSTVEYFAASGIQRVIVGHKPSGDSPAVLSYSASISSAATARTPIADAKGLEVICADISYSDPSFADNRGPNAWCEVLVEEHAEGGTRARVRGALSDGTFYDNFLPTVGGNGAASDGDALIGHMVRLPGDADSDVEWCVKAHLPESGYLLSRGKSRREVNRVVVQRVEDIHVLKHPLLRS